MNRKVALPLVILITLVAFAAGSGVGIAGWIWVMGGNGEPSQAVDEVAQQLSLTDTASGLNRVNVEVPAVPAAPAVAAAVPLTLAEAAPTDRRLFRIDTDQSAATFTLQEDLRGQQIDVVGITQQVGGDIIVDAANLSLSSVGDIIINARTLETDNNFRNRALRSEILRSAQDAYEFITFTPTALEGLSAGRATVGTPVSFTITGDLTIAGVTRSVMFDATVTLTDDQTLRGTASTVVQWSDFGIRIPSVPNVANITPDVTLTIDFVAPLVASD